LKGLGFSDPLIEGASRSMVPLAALAGVYGKVALAGVYRVAGDALCETESLGPRVAYCLEGNVADMGDSRALLLGPISPAVRSLRNPRPTGWGAFSSGGGVGVLGGAGRGIFDMTVVNE
jgi:hypothetical protein